MKRPNMFCIGAAKCGTTTLADMLRGHSQIFVHDYKELEVLDKNNFTSDLLQDYDYYFKDIDDFKYYSDFTVTYLYFHEIAYRIKKYFGSETKIIVLFRDPIERLVSHYREGVSNNPNISSLENLLNKAIKSDDMKSDWNERESNIIINSSLYYDRLKIYMDNFDEVKVILFEDLVNGTDNMLDELYEYLEIKKEYFEIKHSNTSKVVKNKFISVVLKKIYDMFYPSENIRIKIRKNKILWKLHYIPAYIHSGLVNLNKTDGKEKIIISDELYDKIYNYYIDDINKTEKLIGRDLSKWKEYNNKWKS